MMLQRFEVTAVDAHYQLKIKQTLNHQARRIADHRPSTATTIIDEPDGRAAASHSGDLAAVDAQTGIDTLRAPSRQVRQVRQSLKLNRARHPQVNALRRQPGSILAREEVGVDRGGLGRDPPGHPPFHRCVHAVRILYSKPW
jgi:hypothetical protein